MSLPLQTCTKRTPRSRSRRAAEMPPEERREWMEERMEKAKEKFHKMQRRIERLEAEVAKLKRERE